MVLARQFQSLLSPSQRGLDNLQQSAPICSTTSRLSDKPIALGSGQDVARQCALHQHTPITRWYPTRLRIRLKPLARPLEATTSTWWRLLALVGGGLSDMRE
jgi:hypothetical protein